MVQYNFGRTPRVSRRPPWHGYPPPEHAEAWYHWLHLDNPQEPCVFEWNKGKAVWSVEGEDVQPRDMAKRGWRYLEPCLTPEELRALRARIREGN